MGGCFSSDNTADKDKTPTYLYCPRTLEEHSPLPNTSATSNSIYAGEYVDPNLNSSNPNAFPTLIEPVHITNDEAFTKEESIKEAKCEDKEFNVLKSEPEPLLSTEEEDVCPTCFEEYDLENPRIITKCEHHFHMSCILEWMERSDTCPICDQMMIFEMGGE